MGKTKTAPPPMRGVAVAPLCGACADKRRPATERVEALGMRYQDEFLKGGPRSWCRDCLHGFYAKMKVKAARHGWITHYMTGRRLRECDVRTPSGESRRASWDFREYLCNFPECPMMWVGMGQVRPHNRAFKHGELHERRDGKAPWRDDTDDEDDEEEPSPTRSHAHRGRPTREATRETESRRVPAKGGVREKAKHRVASPAVVAQRVASAKRVVAAAKHGRPPKGAEAPSRAARAARRHNAATESALTKAAPVSKAAAPARAPAPVATAAASRSRRPPRPTPKREIVSDTPDIRRAAALPKIRKRAPKPSKPVAKAPARPDDGSSDPETRSASGEADREDSPQLSERSNSHEEDFHIYARGAEENFSNQHHFFPGGSHADPTHHVHAAAATPAAYDLHAMAGTMAARVPGPFAGVAANQASNDDSDADSALSSPLVNTAFNFTAGVGPWM